MIWSNGFLTSHLRMYVVLGSFFTYFWASYSLYTLYIWFISIKLQTFGGFALQWIVRKHSLRSWKKLRETNFMNRQSKWIHLFPHIYTPHMEHYCIEVATQPSSEKNIRSNLSCASRKPQAHITHVCPQRACLDFLLDSTLPCWCPSHLSWLPIRPRALASWHLSPHSIRTSCRSLLGLASRHYSSSTQHCTTGAHCRRSWSSPIFGLYA